MLKLHERKQTAMDERTLCRIPTAESSPFTARGKSRIGLTLGFCPVVGIDKWELGGSKPQRIYLRTLLYISRIRALPINFDFVTLLV